MKSFIDGLKKSIPICIGYFVVSFTFGIYCKNLGINSVASVIISLTNLSSAGQFGGVELIAKHASLIELALVVLVINLRYVLMSISMSQHLDENVRFVDKMIFSFAITDEIYALAIKEKKKINAKFIFGMMILPILGWTLGTLFGVLSFNVFSTRLANAFNIALYAMFIAAIFPDFPRSFKIASVIIFASIISCTLFYVPFFSENISFGFKIIITTILTCTLAAIIFPIKEESEEEKEEEKECI